MRRKGSVRSIVLLIAVLTLSTPFLHAQFEFRTGVPIAGEPYHIAFGDFTGDGKQDAAVTLYGSNSVAVLLGNGDGTFKAPTVYSVGVNPEFISAADLRQKGILDLVVSTLPEGFSVLLGRGDGTFSSAQPFSLPGSGYFLATADFNNDGFPDIYASVDSVSCACISVLLGSGDGTFRPPINTQLPMPTYVAAAGHFTTSGNMDVVAGETTGGSDSIQMLLGNGDGTFRLGASYSTSSSPNDMAIADFNNDQNMDVAVDLPLSGQVTIFLGNGEGTLQQRSIVPASFPAVIQSADFNHDGNTDFVITTGLYSNIASVFLGNGDGTFRSFTNFQAGGGAGSFPTDMNGDGLIDLVVANYFGNAVVTHLNTGVVSFSPSTPLTFKTQKVGTTSQPQVVTLTNTGTATLNIGSMKVTGQFGMKTSCRAKVQAGGSCKISATFSPQSKGTHSGTVTLQDSASSKPQVIALSGVGD